MPIREKYRYAAVLAVIALSILILGLLLKPRPRPGAKADAETVTRAELENLQQLVRRNTLRNLSSNFTSVAGKAAANVVMLQPWNVNGVLVPELGLIVPKRLDALPREFTGTDAKESALPRQWIPGMPFFVGLLPSQLKVSPARTATSRPAEGAWVIALANTPGGEPLVSPGIYNGIIEANCGPFVHQRMLTTIQLTDSHLGGGVFDMAGDLYGIVVPCDDGAAILPVSEVSRAASSGLSAAGGVLSNYGIQLLDVFDAGGHRTLVREVWENWPGDSAGLAPGDEVLTIDAQRFATRQNANALLLTQMEQGHFVRFRRNGRERRVKLEAFDLKNSPIPGIVVAPNTGIPILRVTPGSSAARAGLRSGDRILTIDGRPATAETVADLLGDFIAAAEIDVTVQRPGRHVYVQVNP